MERIVRTLESWERGSATEGERRSAEWIASHLRDLGYRPKIEEEPAHGGYWWPLGIFTGAAAAVGLLSGGRGGDGGGPGPAARALGTVVGAVASFGIWDELGLWREWTRALLPKRTTWNVHAIAGDPDADRTIAIVTHHDAAHTGMAFDFSLPRWYGRTFPDLLEKGRKWPGLMWSVIAGPLLVGIGSLLGRRRVRRTGGVMSALSALSFADIGRSPVVPGANDNLSSVAAMLEVGRALREETVEGVRVLLVATGSEESFEEGMLGFVKRHAHELPKDRTHFIVLDTVGSPHLILLEGEGMLLTRPYDEDLKDEIAAAAEEIGVPIVREHWLSFGSDSLVALRKGYRTATIASFDDLKLPSNYHQPTDVADNLVWETVEQAANVTEATVRRIARTAARPPAS
ncbi:MAG TPA: M28 family peptidase [Solirubrobacteraceae bacterium]|nr:M28 family peptidase [Solirubrobacteraceae bacterium]